MSRAYSRGKCTTPNIYTCVSTGLVAIGSASTALGSLKERKKERKEDEEQCAWAAISVDYLRNACSPRLRSQKA